MIYSIGHGSKQTKDLIEELRAFQVTYLVDVRSKPYSKFNPQFNESMIKFDLESVGIKYVFLGDKLGGLPEDRSCYVDGKVDYEIVRGKKFFVEGIQRLETASSKNINVAIMCSESKPEECHRSKLIGQELAKRNIPILHIISPVRTKTQIDVMNELTGGKNSIDLFDQEQPLTSRKKYD